MEKNIERKMKKIERDMINYYLDDDKPEERKGYTPQLSYQSSCTLRRIAWALGVPMTKAIERVMVYAADTIDRQKVCSGCRDKSRCSDCAFNQQRKEATA